MALALPSPPAGWAAELPIFDAHIHYSHDTRDALPAKTAIEILRKAGVAERLQRFRYVIVEHARLARSWLSELPRDIAEKIAWRTGEALFPMKRD